MKIIKNVVKQTKCTYMYINKIFVEKLSLRKNADDFHILSDRTSPLEFSSFDILAGPSNYDKMTS